MNPHSKHQSLFFTPRSPWGRLPRKHAHQSHMRASEDKKPDPRDSDIVRQPPSEIVKTVAAPANYPTPEQRRQAGDAYRTTPPQKGLVGKVLEHVDGNLDYAGRHPGTEELPDKSGTIRFSTNPKARGELPEYGPEAEEARKKKQGVNSEQADPNQ